MQAATPFDLFAPGAATVATLVGMRVTGLVLVAPVFSASVLPMAVRTAIVILLTMVLIPVASAHPGVVPHLTPSTAVGEALVGFAVGLGAALLVGAAEAAGDFLATQIGLSGASLLDPLNNSTSPVLATFLSMFTVTIMLAMDAHLGMIEALGSSLRAIPAGSAIDIHRGVGAIISLTGSLFVLGLRFAAPVVAAVMVGNAALAVLSRAAPQLNILSVAFPLQIGLGLFAIGATLPLIAAYVGEWPVHYDHQLTTIFGAFLPAGGR